ncbi:MAG: DNA polymerase [Bacteroidales bacterium]
MQQLIQARGYPSELMVVGDYPTKGEYEEGYSFSRSAGNILNQLLAGIKSKKFRAEDLFKTHYIKVPVPGANSPSKKKREEAFSAVMDLYNWDEILAEQIQAISPRVIIAMGEIACKALTGMDKVKNRRGSIYPLLPKFSNKPINVIVTLSCHDLWENKLKPFPYVQWDFSKVDEVINLNSHFKTRELIWIPTSAQELENWWERAKNAKYLTLDIETHNHFITCVGLSHDGYEAISIPLLLKNLDYQTRGFFYKFLKKVVSSGIPIINHNIRYDYKILKDWGFEIMNIGGDTMQMAHCIYPELPKNLGFISSIYTTQPYYKDEGREFDPKIHSEDRLLIYNAKDALVTHQIWSKQIDDAKALKVFDLYKKVHEVLPIYWAMEDRGILVDKAKVEELKQKYERMYASCVSFLSTVAEKRINPLSPKQTAFLLYDVMKLPRKVHQTPQGETVESTDNITIEDLKINATNTNKIILNQIIAARKIAKVLQILEKPVSYDGRFRCSFKLHGTENGRTSGGESLDFIYKISNNKIISENTGMTFQNITKRGEEIDDLVIGKDLRKIFVPTPGYVFIEGDQSQAEARVVAVLSEDFDTLKMFDTTDIHKVTASWIFGVPEDQITEEQRFYGKKTRHAGNYDIQPYELARQLHKPMSFTTALLSKFHKAVPKVKMVFHKQIRELLYKQHYLVSPHRRRRDFFGIINDDIMKEAYATIPQATVSDHTKFTILTQLYKKYPPPLAYPLSESHDSLLFEVREELKNQFMQDFKAAIATPINFSCCSIGIDFDLVIPGEIHIGEISWGEMVKWSG